MHAAAPGCRPLALAPRGDRVGPALGPRRGVQDSVLRPDQPGDVREVHDRRDSACRGAGRSGAQRVRGGGSGRGARAIAQHRLPDWPAEAIAGAARRSQADHHLGHHRHGGLRAALRSRACDHGVRTLVSGVGGIPSVRSRFRRRGRRRGGRGLVLRRCGGGGGARHPGHAGGGGRAGLHAGRARHYRNP